MSSPAHSVEYYFVTKCSDSTQKK